VLKESLVEKLQKLSKKKLQKLKEQQEKLKEHQKFVNILPLQSRSPKTYPSLRELLKELENMKEIVRKH
jgi:hypothetical protein